MPAYPKRARGLWVARCGYYAVESDFTLFCRTGFKEVRFFLGRHRKSLSQWVDTSKKQLCGARDITQNEPARAKANTCQAFRPHRVKAKFLRSFEQVKTEKFIG